MNENYNSGSAWEPKERKVKRKVGIEDQPYQIDTAEKGDENKKLIMSMD